MAGVKVCLKFNFMLTIRIKTIQANKIKHLALQKIYSTCERKINTFDIKQQNNSVRLGYFCSLFQKKRYCYLQQKS